MQVIRFRGNDHPPTHSVLTIGNFDGIHLGHQALIHRLVDEARQIGAQSVLVTFEPHPQMVLGNRIVPQLTSLPQKLRMFEQLGLDAVSLIPFTQELAALSAEDFVTRYLVEAFQVKMLIIGYDFAFGRNREGTAEVLLSLGGKFGFEFDVFPAIQQADGIVSSTRIREALSSADFPSAEKMMGRPFSVMGTVSHGQQRGGGLGFPTANLPQEIPLPLPFGVYASRIIFEGKMLDGVSNYGIKPTVGSELPELETHLFEFSGDLYGKTIEVIPQHFLRQEKKFDSLDALKAQIAADSEAARKLLAVHAAPRLSSF